MEMYHQVRLWYDHILSQTDERSRSWWLMGSPLTPFLTMGVYLGVVYGGPKVMRGRAAWDLRAFLVLYNLALVGLSAYMCSEFFLAAREENYSLLCQDVDYSDRPGAIRMLNVCWWYYFSKYVELADTVLFILRKKNGQISFLHVYHHATMIPFWWMVVAYIPGGQSFFHPLLNTCIHVLMYTYYGLAAVGPHMQRYLWWKKYLTSMQLLQFVLISVHTSYNLLFEPTCPFPKSWEMLALAYALILIVLFANFYRQAYVRKQQQQQQQQGQGKQRAGGESGQETCQHNGVDPSRAKGD